jgi:phage baseplate assembly protein W
MIGDFTTLIRQNLKMLILTNPGERVMIPDFGVGINSYLFENFNNTIYTQIEADIKEQARKYLPVVNIDNVLFDSSDEDNNTLGLSIVYSIPALNVRDLLEFTI